MNYIDFEAGNKAYKLRLNTRNIVALEKTIGRNPVSIFFEGGEERIPTITEMVAILHASLQQFNHGITMADAFDIFDTYIMDNTTMDFIKVIMEVYKVSGLIPKNAEDAELKNE
jgi:hypothetical protein